MLKLADRFWQKVDKDGPVPASVPHLGPCWLWRDFIYAKGYGRIWIKGRYQMAHRVAYELAGEVIPDGLTIDHLCCNRRCVNPSHLEAVSLQENMARADRNRPLLVTCLRGHPYDLFNTIWQAGRRICRECKRLRGAARYHPWARAALKRAAAPWLSAE